jgi:hypothetical protein
MSWEMRSIEQELHDAMRAPALDFDVPDIARTNVGNVGHDPAK